ncbi:hypothetical protein C8R47DRAFT_530295 [Mycena vitilis]|nr:hypothetical protein C8R47DRAFT_530295 [Mycena vitilis]
MSSFSSKEELLLWIRADSVREPFGTHPKDGQDRDFSELIGSIDNFENLNLVDALDRLDRALWAVTLNSTSTDSEGESKAHANLGVDGLERVILDSGWVDQLLNTPAPWKAKTVRDYPEWKSTLHRFLLEPARKAEINEGVVDQFADRQGHVAKLACKSFPGIGPGSITTEPQVRTVLPSGDGVNPDICFYGHSAKEDSPKSLFERRENKTLIVNVFHAHDLQASTGKTLQQSKTKAARGIFTQAYTSSVANTPACKVVWMGHPSLYRIGYRHEKCLYVSNWRSSEPERMITILKRYQPWEAPIVQGHLVRETLALAVADMEEIIQARRRPSTLVGVARLLPSPFDVLHRIWWSHVHLGEDEVYGSISTMGKQISPQFPNVVKPRFVWGNDACIAKAVGPTELDIWTKLSQSKVVGVPALLGTMKLASPPNKGTMLIFVEHCGECVPETVFESDEPEAQYIRTRVAAILRSLWGLGLHHHDIHPRNVVQNGSKVSLIDFGMAVQASTCELHPCPDQLFLQEEEPEPLSPQSPQISELSHSPSSSESSDPSPESSPPQPPWSPKP